jgi:hypothetical protein
MDETRRVTKCYPCRHQLCDYILHSTKETVCYCAWPERWIPGIEKDKQATCFDNKPVSKDDPEDMPRIYFPNIFFDYITPLWFWVYSAWTRQIIRKRDYDIEGRFAAYIVRETVPMPDRIFKALREAYRVYYARARDIRWEPSDKAFKLLKAIKKFEDFESECEECLYDTLVISPKPQTILSPIISGQTVDRIIFPNCKRFPRGCSISRTWNPYTLPTIAAKYKHLRITNNRAFLGAG